ncbi:21130_t:CDS:2 [Entrophospora sp. SA101]|nr:21130_t:CDS:2 [Entrophospora sp. SA101]
MKSFWQSYKALPPRTRILLGLDNVRESEVEDEESVEDKVGVIRPYVSGWENDESLPNGLKYEGVDGCDENGNPIYRQYVGGSAGQSSLIQSLDIVLNIEHYPTGIKPITINNYNTHHSHNSSNGNLNNNNNASKNKRDLHQQQPYVYKIRQNIPGNHRRFLEDLTKVAIVRDYIMLCIGCNDSEINNKLESNRIFENNELVEAYNDCLDKMKTFRSKHLQIVSVYILAQAYIIDDSVTNGASTIKGNTINSSATNISAANSANDTIAKIATNDTTTTNTTNWHVSNDPVSNATTTANIKTNDVNKKIVNNKVTTTLAKTSNDLNIVRGTGGTDLIPFLRQMRNETNSKEIRILKDHLI